MTIDFDKSDEQLIAELPQFFSHPALDRLHCMFLALAEELAVQVERIDDLEMLLVEKGVLNRGELSDFQPSDADLQARLKQHQAYVGRLLSTLEDELTIEK